MSIVADTASTVIPTGTWSIDPAHSTVEFRITHMGLATVQGRAARVTGTIEGGEELSVEGTLTTRGVTKPVTLRGRVAEAGIDPWGSERIGIELATTVDRTAWALDWNAPLPGGGFLLPNDVRLTASFQAVRAG